MKKIMLLFTFILSNLSWGQNNISEYAYIYVPEKFEGFKENQYQLNSFLRWKLRKLGYTILKEEPQLWSLEIKQNPCKVLTASVKDDGNIFTNRVILEFKDCNKNKIVAFKGKSSEKEYLPGFREALSKAVEQVPRANPSPAYSNVSENSIIITHKKVKNEFNDALPPDKQVLPNKEVQENRVSANTKNIRYTNGKIELNYIDLGEGAFALLQPEDSVPFAIFKPSSKEGVYRVRLRNSEQAIGYKEGNKIVIDIQEGENFIFSLLP